MCGCGVRPTCVCKQFVTFNSVCVHAQHVCDDVWWDDTLVDVVVVLMTLCVYEMFVC